MARSEDVLSPASCPQLQQSIAIMDASQSFEYKLTVHQLRPWPLNGVGAGGPQFIAIGWQRGKQTGAVDAVKAKVTAKGYGVYMFNEDLTISANLRKVRLYQGHKHTQRLACVCP